MQKKSAGMKFLPKTGLMRTTENVLLTPHQVASNSAGVLEELYVWKETLCEAQCKGNDQKLRMDMERKPSGKPVSTLNTKYPQRNLKSIVLYG